MKALEQLIQQQNKWNQIFNGRQYEIRTAEGRKAVAEHIDSRLSPENLTCDGELSRTEVARRYKELTQAARELVALDPSVAQYIYELA
jgi:hypothetical protein